MRIDARQARAEAGAGSAAVLRALAEASPDGVLVVDRDARILLFNRRFAEIWELPPEVLEAGDDEQALRAAVERVADPERFLREVRDCYADPSRVRRHQVALADGRVLDRHGAPLHDGDGSYLGWAWYFRDVTPYVRNEQQLMRLAQTLQSSLLPPRPPQIAGLEVATRYVPASAGAAVGGDFYDVFRLGTNAWGLVVGDVCGKGAEAAALTSLLRYTLRGVAHSVADPSQVLQELNRALVSDEHLGERFATAVYARLEQDACGAWVTLSCGGHPLPIVVRRAGWIDVRGQEGGLLGLFEEVDVAEDRVGLGPGDALVFFTDGITDSRSSSGELFGEETLASTLLRCARGPSDAEAIATAVVEDALAHGGGRFTDDVAVVVVRVPPGAADDPAGRLRQVFDSDEVEQLLPGYRVGEPAWGSDRAAPPREARLSVATDPATVPAARGFVTGVLHSWRLSEVAEGDVQLLTTELVTNAIRHGESPFTVLVRYDGETVRVEVGDGSRALPRVRLSPEQEATGGRGVYLVAQLAQAWGVQPTHRGKRVWFELPVPPARPAS